MGQKRWMKNAYEVVSITEVRRTYNTTEGAEMWSQNQKIETRNFHNIKSKRTDKQKSAPKIPNKWVNGEMNKKSERSQKCEMATEAGHTHDTAKGTDVWSQIDNQIHEMSGKGVGDARSSRGAQTNRPKFKHTNK